MLKCLHLFNFIFGYFPAQINGTYVFSSTLILKPKCKHSNNL